MAAGGQEQESDRVLRQLYPYFDVVKTDWRAALTEALTDAYSDKNQWDFLKTLRKFTAKLKDGHVRVNRQGNNFEAYCLPLDWAWIENQLVITNIFDKTFFPDPYRRRGGENKRRFRQKRP